MDDKDMASLMKLQIILITLGSMYEKGKCKINKETEFCMHMQTQKIYYCFSQKLWFMCYPQSYSTPLIKIYQYGM